MEFNPAFYMQMGPFSSGVEALSAFMFPMVIFFLYGMLVSMLLGKKNGVLISLAVIIIAKMVVAVLMVGDPVSEANFTFAHNALFCAAMLMAIAMGGLFEQRERKLVY